VRQKEEVICLTAKPFERRVGTEEAFQRVKATSDKALKTGDMGLSTHRQATQLSRQNDSDAEALQMDSNVRKQCTLPIKDDNQSLFGWYFSVASQE